MSKLSQLIAELCPNGVEYKKLYEIASFNNIGVDKKIYDNCDSVMLLNYMDIYKNKHITKDILTMEVSATQAQISRCSILQGDIFITPSSETIDDLAQSAVAVEDIPNGVYSYHIARIRLFNQAIVNPFFIRYLFRSTIIQKQIRKKATGITRFGLTKGKWENLLFPIPPISIQQEIVRILDSFTELSTELSTELIARKKQYQYYRDTLLTYNNKNNALHNLQFIALEKLLKYKQPTQYIVASENYDNSYKIPVLTAGQSFILGYTDESNGIYQASKNSPAIIFDDFTTSFHWVDFSFKVKSSAMKILTPLDSNLITFRYLYYIMKSINYKPASHSRQWISKYSKFKIPLPPLAEQQRIVDILDRFDTLVNNISIGIPAEIEARDKQYQYYRNKLLSFKRLKEEL